MRARQEREAGAGLRREDDEAVLAREARSKLELGLAAELLEGVGGDAGGDGLRGRGAEVLERGDPRGREPVDLAALDVRDAARVVDEIPVLVAERLELADAAVVARIRLRLGRVGDELLEPQQTRR